MPAVRHNFTKTIVRILNSHHPGKGDLILDCSELLQYINIKTKAADRGSKSRAAFANHYAVYVLVRCSIQGSTAKTKRTPIWRQTPKPRAQSSGK